MRTIEKFKEDKEFIDVNIDWESMFSSIMASRVGRRSAVLPLLDFGYRGESTQIYIDPLSRTNLPTLQAYQIAFNGVYGNNPFMEIILDD